MHLRDEWIWTVHGLPHFRWAEVVAWLTHVHGADEGAFGRAATDVATAWLERLAQALGPSYRLVESATCLLLGPQTPAAARRTLDVVDGYRARLIEAVPFITRFDGAGRIAIALFDGDEAMYRYASAYYPDGEHGAFAGLFLSAGLPHVLVRLSAHASDETDPPDPPAMDHSRSVRQDARSSRPSILPAAAGTRRLP